MLFHSYQFLFVFFPVVLTGFILINSYMGRGHALLWLLLASLWFYADWNLFDLPVLLASIAFNYAVGRSIARAAPQSLHRKYLLILGICANLALLGYFKYLGFFTGAVNNTLGSSFNIAEYELPLAISFFTFQQIAYLVGCNKSSEAESNPLHYSLFVMFFPQLVAGPIVHHREMMPQFASAKLDSKRLEKLSVALTLIAIGLFKKVILGDALAGQYESMHEPLADGSILSMGEAWLGMLCGAFFIYFDYSAYADMAAGIAYAFGIRMPVNFFSPYKALSIAEFWRRWNITLLRFLRDHIYIPLGGNRKGLAIQYMNSLATMTLCGMWHGAGWNFIYWGVVVGVLIMLENVGTRLRSRFGLPSLVNYYAGRLFLRFWVLAAYVMPLAIFMNEDLSLAHNLLLSMIGVNGILLPEHVFGAIPALAQTLPALGLSLGDLQVYGGIQQLVLLSGSLFIIYLLPNSVEIFRHHSPYIDDLRGSHRSGNWMHIYWSPNVRWAALTAALLFASVSQLYQIDEFFYFQF